MGVHVTNPEVRAIIDIGGQDVTCTPMAWQEISEMCSSANGTLLRP